MFQRSLVKTILGGAVALALGLGCSDAAAGQMPPTVQASHDLVDSFASAEWVGVENELRQIFEIYLHEDPATGSWALGDVEAAKAAGVDPALLSHIVEDFNSNSQRVTLRAFGDTEWAKCVIGWAVGTGVIGLVDGTVVGWLQRGKYAQVASWLLRVAPRLALRGGVIGIVAGLAAGVAACSISQ